RVGRARRAPHGERLEALAEASNVSPELLRDVDDLKRPPVTMSTRRLMGLLMLDRALVVIGAALAALAAWTTLPTLLAMAASGLIIAAAWGAGSALAKVRNPDNILPLRLPAQPLRARVHPPLGAVVPPPHPVREGL